MVCKADDDVGGSPEASERWAAIPGFVGLYAASSMGRVLRLPRPGTLDLRLDYPLILEPNYAGHYLWVWLRDHDHQRRRLRVDRLVVCSFSDQPYAVFDVVHLDRDNRNCRLENLVRLNRRTVLGSVHTRRSIIGADDAAHHPGCRVGLVADKMAGGGMQSSGSPAHHGIAIAGPG